MEIDSTRFFSGSFIGVKEINMEIYNRWGQILFSTNDLNFEWDGTFKGKKSAERKPMSGN